jgi:hypothetical protein
MRMHWVGRAAVVIVALLFTTACGTIYSQQGRKYPTYPSSGGVYRGGGHVDSPYQRGIDDGYRRGFDAARDGDRFDPRRESWYRSADRGYDRRYGSRSEYRQVYRDGFMRGYEHGYREARYRRRP